jgi:hypothetical protein
MTIPADELTLVIFNKPLQQCGIEELQQLAEQYPYFGPAHLLLSQKLQQENAASYEQQVQSTSLYFQNRLWLHHLLNKDGYGEVTIGNHSGTFSPDPFEEPDTITEPDKEYPAPQTETISEFSSEPVVTDVPKEEEVQVAAAEQRINENVETISSDMSSVTADTSDKDVLFEPYHTVDYFASQGIKYKEEEKPRDRFSAQLKSFTEWLKTMKKVPVSELIAKSDAGTEKQVEQMAEFSLAERHVITEAMAEVWKKQGNKAKAEDIYNKLSLLDPSKSSYFAAKIEELKKTS